jgi:Tfp pilus assembly protein PilO
MTMVQTKRQSQSDRITAIRRALAIPPMIGVLLWLLIDRFFWPTQDTEIRQWIDQGKSLALEQKKQQAQITEWRQQEQDWSEVSVQYQKTLAQFSLPIQASQLLGNMSRIAQRSAIEIVTIEWLPEHKQERYFEAPFFLRLKGRYASIQDFFSQLNASSPTVVFSRITWQRMSLDRDVVVVDVEASQFMVTAAASTQSSN